MTLALTVLLLGGASVRAEGPDRESLRAVESYYRRTGKLATAEYYRGKLAKIDATEARSSESERLQAIESYYRRTGKLTTAEYYRLRSRKAERGQVPRPEIAPDSR
ncbi:hypothetical protein SAMN05444166_3931 [Singulisphaera sp. GP187]|nr:hypothetical protein SAMN05444166_3931 [Singulisphaera sp. GP187]